MATVPEPEDEAKLDGALDDINEEIDEQARSYEFSEESGDDENTKVGRSDFGQAVLWGTDWTVETLIAQMKRENLEISPQFQRRDAWSRPSKSRFIESLVLGLPIPQIVLAEKKDKRGSFIILDGKQRLLSILQYVGLAPESPNNSFGLSGLEVKLGLRRKKFRHLENDLSLSNDLNAFLTHTIRAVIIRNWPSMDFLHLVFHRLNSGSLKLSPQELRQAILAGPFTIFADDFAAKNKKIYGLLNQKHPDPRMRDTELLVRYISFALFLPEYTGRMRNFLDERCQKLNGEWAAYENKVTEQAAKFVTVIDALEQVFGQDNLARRKGSTLFNRSIFDALAYYATDDRLRAAILADPASAKQAYAETIGDEQFENAVESDTAGIPHTADRFGIMGQNLARRMNVQLAIPKPQANAEGQVRLVV